METDLRTEKKRTDVKDVWGSFDMLAGRLDVGVEKDSHQG